jgi:hypothetical protein
MINASPRTTLAATTAPISENTGPIPRGPNSGASPPPLMPKSFMSVSIWRRPSHSPSGDVHLKTAMAVGSSGAGRISFYPHFINKTHLCFRRRTRLIPIAGICAILSVSVLERRCARTTDVARPILSSRANCAADNLPFWQRRVPFLEEHKLLCWHPPAQRTL